MGTHQPKACVRIPSASEHVSALDSCYTDQSRRQEASIHPIPDSVLLELFGFCKKNRGSGWYPVLEWQLVHVCQRWRNLIYSSPIRLNLELLCTHGTPVKKSLDCWPDFPIIIEYDKVAPEDEENVLAALEHPGRVHRLNLGITKKLWEKIDTAMRKPFPVLTHLWLGCKNRGASDRAPVLPRDFLGGGTLRLQEVHLRDISFPSLPTLLSSANDLVDLRLEEIPETCYLPPEAMVATLAVLTRLKTLYIQYRYPILHATQRLPAPETPTVHLPALSSFYFKGFSSGKTPRTNPRKLTKKGNDTPKKAIGS